MNNYCTICLGQSCYTSHFTQYHLHFCLQVAKSRSTPIVICTQALSELTHRLPSQPVSWTSHTLSLYLHIKLLAHNFLIPKQIALSISNSIPNVVYYPLKAQGLDISKQRQWLLLLHLACRIVIGIPNCPCNPNCEWPSVISCIQLSCIIQVTGPEPPFWVILAINSVLCFA